MKMKMVVTEQGKSDALSIIEETYIIVYRK